MINLDFDCIIGCDPGANGGIAVWRPNQNVKTIRMPKDLQELRADDIKDNPGKAFRIQQLLMNFQKLKDFIEVEGVPYVLVHPISWQSYLKLRKQTEDKTERKNRYKEAAQHYYPEIKATLWNADAVLLMHFGRLKKQKEPLWIVQNLPSDIVRKLTFEN